VSSTKLKLSKYVTHSCFYYHYFFYLSMLFNVPTLYKPVFLLFMRVEILDAKRYVSACKYARLNPFVYADVRIFVINS